MRISTLLTAAALAATSAAAQQTAPASSSDKICLNPHRDYQARAVNDHEIVASNTLGHDHRPVLLSTTCVHLTAAFHFSLSSVFYCLGQGDNVVATAADGHQWGCLIAKVQPYAPNSPASSGP
jgi:hypothetical protein